MNSYCIAGKNFSWNKTKFNYEGYVVFGKDKVFFIVSDVLNDTGRSFGQGLGAFPLPIGLITGAIGTIAGVIIDEITPTDDDPIRRRLRPIDDAVLIDPEWPVPAEFTTALQFYKDDIESITYSKIMRFLTLKQGAYGCSYDIWKNKVSQKEIASFLKKHGWIE